jgi:hypothetical protein
VGSSISRICGRVTRQRASATSWRWPPDSSAPPSPTGSSQPCGWCGDQAVQAGQARHLGQARGVGRRAVQQHVVAQRAVEQARVLADEADAGAVVGRVDLAQVHAVDLDLPAAGWYRPASSRSTVLLPEPMRPRMATRSPGSNFSVTPFSTRGPSTPPVAG